MVVTGQVVVSTQPSGLRVVLLHYLHIGQIYKRCSVDWEELPVRVLPYNALSKHKTFDFVPVGDGERNFHIEGAFLPPFAVFQLVAPDLLAPADTNIVTQEADIL